MHACACTLIPCLCTQACLRIYLRVEMLEAGLLECAHCLDYRGPGVEYDS